ncbi:MAG: ATP-binding protein [Gammaproteobacteria bacterium]
MLKHLFRRGHPKSEREQAFLRLFVLAVLYLYLYINLPPEAGGSLVLVLIAIGAVSLGLFVLALISSQASKGRAMFGMLFDVTAITYLMATLGEISAPLFGFYLWLTLGNGFRHGEKMLYASSLLSVIGFLIVMMTSSYWAEHRTLAIGLLASLIILPVYVALLLRRLNSAVLEAKIANEAKSGFLASMSHEIRTPINGIIGMSDLMIRAPLTEKQKGHAKSINESAHTLLELVNDILDISKIEAGKIHIENIDFDLPAALESIIVQLRQQAEDRGLDLNLEIDSNVPHRLNGDMHHLRQVLINLVSNAVKFTLAGYIKIRVSPLVTRAEKVNASQWLLFEVIDTGIGIAAEAKEHIFESFTQADESISRKFGGTGLGISISRQLVELMGGRIGLDSNIGQGTRFWFELAFTPTSADTADNPLLFAFQTPLHDTSGNGNYQPARTLTLLVAEDNNINQQVIQELLGNAGHDVAVVSNGNSLLEKLDEQSFDAVIMDLHMPKMDGIETIRRLRAETDYQTLPVIVFSADATPEAIASCERTGADIYLTKPIEPYRLLAIIDKFCNPDNDIPLPDAATGTETAQTGTPVDMIKLEQLAAMAQGPGFMDKLIREFIHDADEYINKLGRHLETGELEATRQLAHALRSSALSIGCIELADSAAAIELAAETELHEKQNVFVRNLSNHFDTSRSILLGYLQQ